MRIAALFITMFFCVLCQARTFECGPTSTPVERMICSDLALSRLDDEMGRLYAAVLRRSVVRNNSSPGLTMLTSPEEMRTAQRAWLVKRNQCTSTACVDAEYKNQLKALQAIIRIPQYDRSGPKSDETRIVGIDCDEKAKTLEVGYFTDYNLPAKEMPLWDLWDLKTNSAPDEQGREYVLALHDVTRVCTLGADRYTATIRAVPGNWSLNGQCGGDTNGQVIIRKDGKKIFDGVFEPCMSKEVIAKVQFTAGDKKPKVTRMTDKEYYGYEK